MKHSWPLLILLVAAGVDCAMELASDVCSSTDANVDIEMPGASAQLMGLFPISSATDTSRCLNLGLRQEAYGIILYQAAKFALKTVNTGAAIKIGMKAYDTCASRVVATAAVRDFYPQLRSSMAYCTNGTSGLVKPGVVGGYHDDVIQATASLLNQLEVPQISFGTSQISHNNKKEQYTYLLRLGSSEDNLVQAVVAVLKKMNWKYYGIVYSRDEYSSNVYNKLVSESAKSGLCVAETMNVKRKITAGEIRDGITKFIDQGITGIVYLGVYSNALDFFNTVYTTAKSGQLQWVFPRLRRDSVLSRNLVGSLFLEQRSRKTSLERFRTYFLNLDPRTEERWFADWYMAYFSCNIPSLAKPDPLVTTCRTPYRTNLLQMKLDHDAIENVMDAVAVYAEAIRDAAKTGNLRGMTSSVFFDDYLKKVGGTFNGPQSPFAYRGYDIVNRQLNSLNYDEYKIVGNFTSDGLLMDDIIMYGNDRMTPLTSTPSSTCSHSQCQYCLSSHQPTMHHVTDGRLFIGGMFSVHTNIDGSCGSIDFRRAYAALAFDYAIKNVKRNTIVDTIGGVFIDVCNNPVRAINFINAFHGKTNKISDLNVDPKDVIGYTDDLSSDEAVMVSPVLSSLGIPQLSSTATLTQFDSVSMPLYGSIRPSDYRHAQAIVAFLTHNKWKFIQVVSNNDKHSMALEKELKKAAILSSVCIAATHLSQNPNDANELLRKLQLKPAAKIIVVIGSLPLYRSLLRAIKSTNAIGQFILVSTDHSGNVRDFVRGVETEAHGHFLVKLVANFRLDDFNQYLRNVDVRRSKLPFVRELHQHQSSCYLDDSLRGRFLRPCLNATLANNPLYADDIAFTIEAVAVLKTALARVLTDICGRAYVCSGVEHVTDLRERIRANVKSNFGVFTVMNYNSSAPNLFVKVGYIKASDNKYMPVTSKIALPIHQTLKPVVCDHFCSECLYLHNHEPYLYERGRIVIGSSISMHGNSLGNPFECGKTKGAWYEQAAAVNYAVNEINSRNVLNGVQLGTLMFDVCDSGERSMSLVSGVYDGTFLPQLPEFHQDQVRGWLPFSAVATERTASFLSKLNIPVVTPFANSIGFQDQSKYPTLFSTVPHAARLGHVFGKLLKNLGKFHYINILHSNDRHGESTAETINSILAEYGICVLNKFKISRDARGNILDLVSSSSHVVVVISDDEEEMLGLLRAKTQNNRGHKLLFITTRMWPMVERIQPMPQNVISVTMKRTHIAGFNDTSSYGVFFQQMLPQQSFRCSLRGTKNYHRDCSSSKLYVPTSTTHEQGPDVFPTINAVYALASAIHRTLQKKCNASYSDVCDAFVKDPDTNRMIVDNLKRVSFKDAAGGTFQFTENRDYASGYSVMHLGASGYQEVAQYTDNKLTLLTADLASQFTGIVSTCSILCTQCIRSALNITYIPGDLYLAGIFDVHHKSISPFTCGRIKTLHGFQLLEAFQFAVKKVNSDGILNGVTLGGIGLDGCESAVRTGFLVSNIHQRMITLQRNGQKIDPHNIVSYIGTYETARSRYLARILTPLKLPQISYGSTSMELSNRDRYPYFLRTVPADNEQSRVIIDFLKKYKVQYVQLLNSPTSYGQLGVKEFTKQALANRICIAQTVQFKDNRTVTRESANDALTQLLRKPLANVVVIFADTSYIKPFLLAVKRNRNAKSAFRFLGTVSWGVNNEIVKETIPEVIGSMTITLQSTAIPEFYRHMYEMKPSSNHVNPWFNEYYEAIQNCYLSSVDRRFARYPKKCTDSMSNYATSPRFVQDSGAIHVINAVYSAAHGLHGSLKRVCGENYHGVCREFTERSDRGELLRDAILKSSFKDLTGDNFAFDGRSGNKGYTLHAIETSTTSGGYVYHEVGTYKRSTLKMTALPQVFVSKSRSCEGEGICSECPGIRNPQTRVKVTPSSYTNSLSLVAIFDLHSSESTDEFRCGNMTSIRGMKNLLAFYTALDRYNSLVSDKSSGLTFSAIALDTCSNSIRVSTDLYSMISKNLCHLQKDIDAAQREYLKLNRIGGVVCMGEYNSMAAYQVLSPYSVSLVSPDATYSMFRNNQLYPYFLRVLPPDDIQATVILSILRKYEWSYISVIYTLNKFGTSNNDAIVNAGAIGSDKICIGLSIGLAESASLADIQRAVGRVHEKMKTGAHVVVLFTSYDHTSKILDVTKSQFSEGKITWIGGTHWGIDEQLLEKYSPLVAGSITLQMESMVKYSLSSKIRVNQRHPGIISEWYDELIKLLSNQTEIKADHEVLQTVTATWTMAKGIESAYKKICKNVDVTKCMQNDPERFRSGILNEVKKYEWELDTGLRVSGLNIKRFHYNDERYGNLGFVVHRITADNGNHHYTKIGKWNGNLDLATSSVEKTVSFCKAGHRCTCEYGSAKAAAATGPDYSSINKAPRNYYHYNDAGEQVYIWPIWAVVMAVLTSIMLLVAVILFIILLIIYPNKSGTTILAFLLMIGIIAIYVVNFAFFVHAGRVTCALRRFFLGVVYAICFAALLVKAADNWRHSNDEAYSEITHKYKGITSALCLLLIALFIVAIQLFIPIMWLILISPTATNLAPNALTHDYYWCDPPLWHDIYMILAFIYILLLLILIILFSAMSWNRENNLNESRWIMFAGCASLGIIMVWMVVSTMSSPPFRDVAVVVGNWVNATVLLLCFPIRKTVWYAIVSRRQKEDEKHMREGNHTLYNNEGYSEDYGSDINMDHKINLSRHNVSYDNAAFSRRVTDEGASAAHMRGSASDYSGKYTMTASGSATENSLLASSGLLGAKVDTVDSTRSANSLMVDSQMIGGNLASQQQKTLLESTRQSYTVRDKYQKTYVTEGEPTRLTGPVPYIETTLEGSELPKDDVITTSVEYDTLDFGPEDHDIDLNSGRSEHVSEFKEFSEQRTEISDINAEPTVSSVEYSTMDSQFSEPSVVITQLQPEVKSSIKSDDNAYSMPYVSDSNQSKAINVQPAPKIVVTTPENSDHSDDSDHMNRSGTLMRSRLSSSASSVPDSMLKPP